MSLSDQVSRSRTERLSLQALEPPSLGPLCSPLPARRPLYPHPDLHLLQLPCKRSEKSPTPPQPKEGR
ncbi:hypothetical protein CLIM01_03955 [Colletotrichum limetticola]|uniref:Uncharacterized protein n=1 Tax=Colletotrichum limetticola TaxID=1209924 RepID=A0ABQ9Q4B8_9PEZI|nr:hypothetical protein CLIM01_03955 [Colletotrichum limetticola]